MKSMRIVLPAQVAVDQPRRNPPPNTAARLQRNYTAIPYSRAVRNHQLPAVYYSFAGNASPRSPHLIFRGPGFILISMKKTIILLLVLICAVPIFGLENISVYGRLVDYAWAHGSDELAVLFIGPNDGNIIFVINAESARVEGKYFLPETADFNCFDWNSDDNGFILAGPRLGEFPKSSFFSFKASDHSFTEVFKEVKREQMYIDNVAVDAGLTRMTVSIF
jgi:hypothetical protein